MITSRKRAACLRQKIIQTKAIQQQRMESANGIKQKLQKSRATHMQQRNAPAELAKTRIGRDSLASLFLLFN